VDFLGRADDQVKVRGFRIELGEIEAALARHPAVAESVVLVRQDEPGRKQLVAYLVVASTAPPSGELREFLAGTLPEYMVPSVFVALDELPLSPNGKVDRKALPAPEPTAAAGPGYVAPEGLVQNALAGIWAEVLGVERVGARDNFFELGGDSILSIQVVSRARQAGLRLTTKDVFRHQTIAELAPFVTAVGAADGDQPVVGPVPLTPIQHWFFAADRRNPHHFNQSALVDLAGDVDEHALRAALDALLVHHDALRMRFEHVDGEWRQHNPAPDTAAAAAVLRRHDLSDVAAADQPVAMEKIADDIHASFDLGRGPLLRAGLFARGNGRAPCLLLVAHHLVIDGVSWRILLDDLETAYVQAVRGETVRLGPKTTSYRDWAHRLAEHVAGGGLDHEVEHWAGALDARPLPTDRPPAPDPGPAQTLVVRLTAEDTETVLRAAPSVYRTRINDVLLTGLGWALARWTGRGRVSIELEGHGREEILDGIDLSRTVGWFTSIFPVALDLPGDLRDAAGTQWRTLVRAVRRQLRAVPGNGLGFGALRHLGAPEVRERLNGPGPQVVFNYLGQWDARSAAEPGEGLYQGAHSSLGQEHDPAEHTVPALEVIGAAQEGRLEFAWYYRPDLYDRSTVAAIANDFGEALRSIARECREVAP
ncbi:MAG TPA: condensation domain-containing protein, partial [Streptosporangiaceae bacterium]|nr:condensation domain-containing protein [Streptosporangiaceae bacterium]